MITGKNNPEGAIRGLRYTSSGRFRSLRSTMELGLLLHFRFVYVIDDFVDGFVILEDFVDHHAGKEES